MFVLQRRDDWITTSMMAVTGNRHIMKQSCDSCFTVVMVYCRPLPYNEYADIKGRNRMAGNSASYPCRISFKFWLNFSLILLGTSKHTGEKIVKFELFLLTFNVHGSVHRKNIPIHIQQDATLHSLLYLETALHVSGGTPTHHQERIQL